MSDPKQQVQHPQQRIQIQLDKDVADGHYSNLVLINHSPAEFILDFARVVPGSQSARVQTRAILSPLHAKNLLTALESNIKKFEENFGEIKLHGKEDTDKSFGFQV